MVSLSLWVRLLRLLAFVSCCCFLRRFSDCPGSDISCLDFILALLSVVPQGGHAECWWDVVYLFVRLMEGLFFSRCVKWVGRSLLSITVGVDEFRWLAGELVQKDGHFERGPLKRVKVAYCLLTLIRSQGWIKDHHLATGSKGDVWFGVTNILKEIRILVPKKA